MILCHAAERELFKVRFHIHLDVDREYVTVPANEDVAQSIFALHVAQLVIDIHHSVIRTSIAMTDQLVYRVADAGVFHEYVGAVASCIYAHVDHVVRLLALSWIRNLILISICGLSHVI